MFRFLTSRVESRRAGCPCIGRTRRCSHRPRAGSPSWLSPPSPPADALARGSSRKRCSCPQKKQRKQWILSASSVLLVINVFHTRTDRLINYLPMAAVVETPLPPPDKSFPSTSFQNLCGIPASWLYRAARSASRPPHHAAAGSFPSRLAHRLRLPSSLLSLISLS